MKIINECHNNDTLLLLRDEINLIVDLIKVPSYCESKISILFNKCDLHAFSASVKKFSLKLYNLSLNTIMAGDQ